MGEATREFAGLVASIVDDARRHVATAQQLTRAVSGSGEACGGAIRVTVDGSGRIGELIIDRESLRFDRRGEVDLGALALDIRAAVNEAFMAAHRAMGEHASHGVTRLGTQLDQISDGMDRAFEQVANDLARVRHR